MISATPSGPQTDWFDAVPKVELHLHLEGAIPHAALWELVQKYGGCAEIPDLAALKARFAYRDFPHFIETWIWKNQFLREYEDFTFIAESVARDLARQHIRYGEVFYSPPDFARHGLNPQELTAAIRKGFARVPQTEISLIADLVRDWGPEKAAATLAAVAEVQDQGVIGIGLGGFEDSYPAELFARVYADARKAGFHTTSHAGETGGAGNVWDVVRHLRVERIGHGTHAWEDARLLDELAQTQLPLEVCPLSNIRTGVVASLVEHPVRRFFERGLSICINTDDPQMFGNSLAQEYRLLEEQFGFSRQEVRGLILQAIRASWLPAEQKERLRVSFLSDPSWGTDAG